MDQSSEAKLADSLHDSVQQIEEKVKLAASSLGRIVDEVENVFRSLERLVSLFGDNRQSLSELKEEATTAVAPAVQKGKDVLRQGVSESPVPLMLGAALVIGGLGLLGYAMSSLGSEQATSDSLPRSPDEPTASTPEFH